MPSGSELQHSLNLWILLGAAFLLSLERICYLWIWRKPAAFRYWCARPLLAWIGGPVDILALLFCGFKALQLAVFVSWGYVHGNGSLWPLNATVGSLIGGGLLIAVGQSLNIGVFYRLGKVGVFYGNKFGYKIPWQRGFPFCFLSHPQYVGAVLSIWGFFLLLRFPHHDWYLIPALETLYYAAGAYFERERRRSCTQPKRRVFPSIPSVRFHGLFSVKQRKEFTRNRSPDFDR
jgi:phosphatidyl-N-methylethanolamine N-methyltransferase